MESPFVDLANSIGACKLNVSDNEFGFYLHLFNSKNEAVGMYKMTPRLRGFSIQQLADQHRRLFFCKKYNQDRKMWESYIDGNLVKADIYKEGCGHATILKDDKWSVIDRKNNVVVLPGKYDYIDGFDKCGLARVKINGKTYIFEPEKNICDRWGIIDTTAEDINNIKEEIEDGNIRDQKSFDKWVKSNLDQQGSDNSDSIDAQDKAANADNDRLDQQTPEGESRRGQNNQNSKNDFGTNRIDKSVDNIKRKEASDLFESYDFEFCDFDAFIYSLGIYRLCRSHTTY
jgi:hypothetical protein